MKEMEMSLQSKLLIMRFANLMHVLLSQYHECTIAIDYNVFYLLELSI